MVEAPERWACEACFDTGLQADGETPCPCQDSRLPRMVRDLKRQIAELRAELNANPRWKPKAEELAVKLVAAEAENARLRTLPLKDEVERELRKAHDDTMGQAGKALLDKSVDGRIKANWLGGKANGLATALDILSRLRAGEQEGKAPVEVAGLDEYEGQITDPIERAVADRNREARIRAAAPSHQGDDRG